MVINTCNLFFTL